MTQSFVFDPEQFQGDPKEIQWDSKRSKKSRKNPKICRAVMEKIPEKDIFCLELFYFRRCQLRRSFVMVGGDLEQAEGCPRIYKGYEGNSMRFQGYLETILEWDLWHKKPRVVCPGQSRRKQGCNTSLKWEPAIIRYKPYFNTIIARSRILVIISSEKQWLL